jgi:hypothetical protein
MGLQVAGKENAERWKPQRQRRKNNRWETGEGRDYFETRARILWTQQIGEVATDAIGVDLLVV